MSLALELSEFGVKVGSRSILDGVELSVPDRGVVALMGPGGAGKTTLVRVLTEFAGHPTYQVSGTALYAGEPVSEDHCGALVRQRLTAASSTVFEALAQALPNRSELTKQEQRDILEQRLLALELQLVLDRFDDDLVVAPRAVQRIVGLICATLCDPRLVCVDELTAGLEDEAATEVLRAILQVADDRGVLFVTHNQQHAREVADYTALLAGGRLIEYAVTDKFFENPEREETGQYVKTGGCAVPSINATTDELERSYQKWAEDSPEKPEKPVVPPRPVLLGAAAASGAAGPRGFRWLVPAQLGGTPYPGIVSKVRFDLEALARVGVTHLVTLTEEPAVFAGDARELGLENIFFPIDDMEAPGLADADAICREVEELIAGGAVVAFHCKAGIGRTGTMLAAQLIHRGASAHEALTKVRRVHPRWVQSKSQEEFLCNFARFVNPGESRNSSPSV